MSWHYLQEREGVFSLPDYLGGLRSRRARLTITAETYYCNASETDTLTDSQSGMMYKLSTPRPGKDSSTLFQEGFPAKTSAHQAGGKGLPAAVAVYGSSISESLKVYGLGLSSPKTPRSCGLVDSAPSSKGLPRWGMTCGGVCWELGTSAHHTSGIACGSLVTEPTPTAIHRANEGNVRLYCRMVERGDITLNEAIAVLGKDPREGHGKFTPTPTSHDAKTTGAPTEYTRNSITLGSMAARGKRGRLNPQFSEWLMGWPIGWTAREPLATDKFRKWLRQHGVS